MTIILIIVTVGIVYFVLGCIVGKMFRRFSLSKKLQDRMGLILVLHAICKLSANPLTIEEISEMENPQQKLIRVIDAIYELSRKTLEEVERS